MPITPADLLQPAGELEAADFPMLDADGLTTRLQAYIDDGYARVAPLDLTDDEKDRAVRAYSYGRSYRSILSRLSRNPATVTLEGEGQRVYLSEQLRTFKENAVRWEQDYDAITASDTPTPEETPSAAAVNRYVW
jgi:hypothetical protein